jgi:hypothetical protein
MRLHRHVAIAAALLTACAVAGQAAEPHDLVVGTRVRARLESGARVQGVLIAFDADGLRIATQEGKQPTLLPEGRFDTLQLSAGRNHAGGLLRGALFGAALAAAITFGDGSCSGSDIACTWVLAWISLYTVPLGALVGLAASPERWQDVPRAVPPLRRRNGLGLDVVPVRHGGGFALTYAF